MRKLHLRLDTLRVESFEPGTGPRALRGTVRARETDTCGIPLPHTQETWPPPPPPEPVSDWCPPATTDYSNYSCFSCAGTCLKYECEFTQQEIDRAG